MRAMPVTRTCDEPSCRKRYAAKRRDSRFCSDSCRQKASRTAAASKVVTLEAAPPPPPDDLSDSEREERALARTAVYRATLAELEEAGRVDTPLGAAALMLARRLDLGSAMDTASSLAGGVRGLRDVLTDALRGAAVADDPVDQLRQARERRRRSA